MQSVKLRVFVLNQDMLRRDYVVMLPGDTPVADAQAAVHAELSARIGAKFKITGVNLYPHWNRKDDENE